MHFTYRMLSFQFFSPDDTPALTRGGHICLILTNSICLPIAFALVPFSLRILLQLYNNATSLEMLRNIQIRMPCSGEDDEESARAMPNDYDMLWLPNIKQVMGPNLLLWLVPFAPEMRGEGLYFPKIPEVSGTELALRLGKSQKKSTVDTE